MATPTNSGSHPGGQRRGRSLAWLWILLAALLLGLLAWWILSGDDEDDVTSPPVATEQTEEPLDDEPVEETEEPLVTEAPDPQETDESPTTTTVGLVLVGEIDLLAEDVDPTTLIGQPVEAQSVMVQAVVADEAFLVGPDPERTVLVRLENFAGEGAPESPVDINEGDTVSFTGTVEEIDETLLADLQLVDEEALAGNIGDVYIQVDELLPPS